MVTGLSPALDDMSPSAAPDVGDPAGESSRRS